MNNFTYQLTNLNTIRNMLEKLPSLCFDGRKFFYQYSSLGCALHWAFHKKLLTPAVMSKIHNNKGLMFSEASFMNTFEADYGENAFNLFCIKAIESKSLFVFIGHLDIFINDLKKKAVMMQNTTRQYFVEHNGNSVEFDDVNGATAQIRGMRKFGLTGMVLIETVRKVLPVI